MKAEKLYRVVRGEFAGFSPRLLLARLLVSPMPVYTGSRTRAAIFRMLGFNIGSGTFFFGTPYFVGRHGLEKNLTIGRQCLVSLHIYFDLADKIYIGDYVGLGPGVMLITGNHMIGNSTCRIGHLNPKPITICDGSWLGAGALIMPGVTVGPSSVVAAGAVVTRDVLPNTIVAGSPAKVIRELEPEP